MARLGVFIRGRSRVPSARASREFAAGAKQRVSGIERVHSFRQPDSPMNRRYLKDTQPRSGRVQRLAPSFNRGIPASSCLPSRIRAAIVWHRPEEKSLFDGLCLVPFPSLRVRLRAIVTCVSNSSDLDELRASVSLSFHASRERSPLRNRESPVGTQNRRMQLSPVVLIDRGVEDRNSQVQASFREFEISTCLLVVWSEKMKTGENENSRTKRRQADKTRAR